MNFMNTCTSADAEKKACYQHSASSTPFACLGARCMAWRYSDLARPKFFTCDNPIATEEPEDRPPNCEWVPFDPADGDPAGWVEHESATNARRRGYCGIVGRPEAPADELLSRLPELTDFFRAVLR